LSDTYHDLNDIRQFTLRHISEAAGKKELFPISCCFPIVNIDRKNVLFSCSILPVPKNADINGTICDQSGADTTIFKN
jgi:hypothetical protein